MSKEPTKNAYEEILEEPWAHAMLLMGESRYLHCSVLLGFCCFFRCFFFCFFKEKHGKDKSLATITGSKNYHVMNTGLLLGHVLTDLLLGGRCFHSKTIIINGTVMQQRCCGGLGDHLPGPF